MVGVAILLVACIYPAASEKHGIHGHEDSDHQNNEGHQHEHQDMTLS